MSLNKTMNHKLCKLFTTPVIKLGHSYSVLTPILSETCRLRSSLRFLKSRARRKPEGEYSRILPLQVQIFISLLSTSIYIYIPNLLYENPITLIQIFKTNRTVLNTILLCWLTYNNIITSGLFVNFIIDYFTAINNICLVKVFTALSLPNQKNL